MSTKVLFSILCCLLLCLPPGFGKLINNTHNNDLEKLTIEQGNALWFSQSVQRCWVCADCPEVRNHRKYPNAFLRFCPPTYYLEASYNCVSYIVQKYEVTASVIFLKKEVYKGCAAYEGLCKDIVGRDEFVDSSSKSNKLLECYMCKGDMCNRAPLVAVFPSFLGILLSFLFY